MGTINDLLGGWFVGIASDLAIAIQAAQIRRASRRDVFGSIERDPLTSEPDILDARAVMSTSSESDRPESSPDSAADPDAVPNTAREQRAPRPAPDRFAFGGPTPRSYLRGFSSKQICASGDC